MANSRNSLRMAVVLLDDFSSTLTRLCGDKKNRNPHVFPIFPVDYPFICKRGTLFIMDCKDHARTKAITITTRNSLAKRAGRFYVSLMFAFVVTASSGFVCWGQQPVKSGPAPVVRPRTANPPAKVSSSV